MCEVTETNTDYPIADWDSRDIPLRVFGLDKLINISVL